MIQPPIEDERDSYIIKTDAPRSKWVNADFIEIYPSAKSVILSVETDQGMYSESTSITLSPALMREVAGLLQKLADEIDAQQPPDETA